MELPGAIEDYIPALAFIPLYFFLFILAKWMKDFLSPFSLSDELTRQDNLAVALTMGGYYLGMTAIFIGALLGPSHGLTTDLMLVGGYSLLGLVFLNLSRYFNDKILLRKFCNIEQLTQEHNVAVGAVQGGTYVATGLIAAGSVMGVGGGIHTAIVFFVLGQLSLLIFGMIYNWLTPYCIHEELGKKNTAAGVAFSGTLVALGIIVLNGVSGDFISWQVNITHFAIVNVIAFIFLPIVRLILDKLVIPGDDLNREIVEDRNLGAGILEAIIAISFAIVLKAVL